MSPTTDSSRTFTPSSPESPTEFSPSNVASRERHEVDAAILTTAAAERALAHALVDAVAELEAAR